MKNRISVGFSVGLVAIFIVAFVSTSSACDTTRPAPRPSITVVSPIGDISDSGSGEGPVWCPGTVRTVMWTCSGLQQGNVQVTLVNEITGNMVPIGSTTITVNGGYSFDFIVPSAPLGHYYVVVQAVYRGRMTAWDIGGEVVVQEANPGPIEIVSPANGSTLINGQKTLIRWTGGTADDTLELWIGSSGNGQLFADLGSVSATQGACAWTVNLSPGTYKYAILLVGSQQVTFSGSFTVEQPTRRRH